MSETRETYNPESYTPGLIGGEAARRLAGEVHSTVLPAFERAARATQFPAQLERHPISGALRRRLKVEDADTIADTAITQAKEGNYRARDWITNRLEGLPVQTIREGISEANELADILLYRLADTSLIDTNDYQALPDSESAGSPSEPVGTQLQDSPPGLDVNPVVTT